MGGTKTYQKPVWFKECIVQQPKASPLERVQSAYQQLAEVSKSLNSASDSLGRSIAGLENNLKNLGLGISSWVRFQESYSRDRFHYTHLDLGYAKVGKTWGLAIKTVEGNQADDEDEIETCLFADAPRGIRIKAIDSIPDLLEKLIKDSMEATAKVETGALEIDSFAKAIADLSIANQSDLRTSKKSGMVGAPPKAKA